MKNYILIDRVPTPCPDITRWAMWYETADRTVAKTDIDGVRVSTVFLGYNHGFWHGEKLFFETMIFGGQFDQECMRCETWQQAEAQHREACEMVRFATQN